MERTLLYITYFVCGITAVAVYVNGDPYAALCMGLVVLIMQILVYKIEKQ